MNITGFHLPHNAILPNEVEFILSLIDIKKDYYLYDDLKQMMFEQEIIQGKFQIFHPGMYKRFMRDKSLKEMYYQILKREKSYSDVKTMKYTTNKTLNGCWNEQARDYFEFIAFTGLMPSYYKGKAIENEKRYYIGETLKQYKKRLISYKDVLFKMKFRNASKNYENIEQYNVRNRPFVVAIKLMQILKSNGYNQIDGLSLSYLIRNTMNEDDLDNEEIKNNIKPLNFSDLDDNAKKELGRGSTFLKKHLSDGLGIKLLKGRKTIFDLNNFDISNYKFKNKSVFIGDIYGDLEVTPLFLKYLSNPNLIKDKDLKKEFCNLGLIQNNVSNYDFNIDTDLSDRNLVLQYLHDNITNVIYSNRIETTNLYKEGKQISESGVGPKYEEFLFNILNNKFGGKDEFGKEKVTYLGANNSGERLSDIIWDVKIRDDDGNMRKIRIIIEAKSGYAITSFDERKEKDDIMNTLADRRFATNYDGVWYMVIDSNKIPKTDVHGGFRRNNTQVSFKQKLLRIQSAVMPATQKLTMVTAFSYEEFMKFFDSINYNSNTEYLTKIQAPDFWTWSTKFMETSYVTIRA